MSSANAENKERHLKGTYRITWHKNKVPINLIDKHIQPKEDASLVLIREGNYTINLVIIIYRNPFTKALIYFAVIC